MKKLILGIALIANIIALCLSYILFDESTWDSFGMWEYTWRERLYIGAAFIAPIASLILLYLAIFENGYEYIKTHMQLRILESKRQIAENKKNVENLSSPSKK